MRNNYRLYAVWAGIKQRCLNPKSALFKHYGGRGISVCREWAAKDGYKAFSAWALANGYQIGLSIERKANNEGYNPQNCIWATREVNLRNRRMTPEWLAAIRKAQEKRRANAAEFREEHCLIPQTDQQKARANQYQMGRYRARKFKSRSPTPLIQPDLIAA